MSNLRELPALWGLSLKSHQVEKRERRKEGHQSPVLEYTQMGPMVTIVSHTWGALKMHKVLAYSPVPLESWSRGIEVKGESLLVSVKVEDKTWHIISLWLVTAGQDSVAP